MNFELTHLVKLYWWKKERKAFYLSLHVLFSRKCLLRTILLRLQLEMGLTFYAVIISEPCEGLAICRAKAVQYLHFSVIRSKYWSDPWGWTHARYFTALNAPEPQKFVGESKYSLWWSFIMILKTFPLDYVWILFGENWGWSL